MSVPREIIDDRLIGALHVRALGRGGFAHQVDEEHVAFQVSTLDALMAGDYDGDTTVGELLEHGDLGIGTIADAAHLELREVSMVGEGNEANARLTLVPREG